MAYVPTGLTARVDVVRLALPVTPDVARISLFLKPVIETVSDGLASP